MHDKVVAVDEAIALVADGDTLAVAGFGVFGVPEALLAALEQRFLEDGEPSGLTLLCGAAPGDGATRGVNHLAHAGLLRRVVGSHFVASPAIVRLMLDGDVEAYNLPLGVLTHLVRDMASGLTGRATPVGLGTFVDPRLEGGRVNDRTADDLVSVVELAGRELLHYAAVPVSVAFLRGTAADPEGNLVMDREALTLDASSLAVATKNNGGVVIAQVEYVAERGSLSARRIVVPGALVDAVVVAAPAQHQQSLLAAVHNVAFSAEARVPLDRLAPMPLDERKVVARRAAFELPLNGIVNLGVGMPEGVAVVANEEQLLRYVTLTTEAGTVGGMPASAIAFGAAFNPDAVVDMDRQFDLYVGGGLDLSCLGMAQCDERGNVNVSRFGGRLSGAGGFIDITHGTDSIVFVGMFTASGLDTRVENGALNIVAEGRVRKFLGAVDQVTFSGERAAAAGKRVLFVTERCVFRLTTDGLQLVEVAQGIDIERDVLAHMDFTPVVDGPSLMNPAIFGANPMGLLDTLLSLRLEDRFSVDTTGATLFLNLEGLQLRSVDDLDRLGAVADAQIAASGRPRELVIGDDDLDVAEELGVAFESMIEGLADSVSRYTTSAFMRRKLGDRLDGRSVHPNVFESRIEAQRWSRGGGGP